MARFEFEDWDHGRLRVNREYADLLRGHLLTSFKSMLKWQGKLAKSQVHERSTSQMELADARGRRQTFFLKRHVPPRLKEYVKPLMHLRLPMLGARHEWDAILRFHAAGVPTMIPVALGQSGRHSFLLTAAIEDCVKLSDWAEGQPAAADTRRVIHDVAQLARQMHTHGLHHQDFYLVHLLLPQDARQRPIHVIDLGRARHCRRLSTRWIVKDLAQLAYSAGDVSLRDRLRFLRTYLGRRLRRDDRHLIRRVESKSRRIARHTQKHGL